MDFLNKIAILAKYSNYGYVLLLIFMAKLLKYNNNNYAIKLKIK